MKRVEAAAAVGMLICLVQPVAAACLEMEYDGLEDHWINQCPVEVGVNWTDAGSCKDWHCFISVPPKGRRDAGKFTGVVKWCECRGAGCKVQGPC